MSKNESRVAVLQRAYESLYAQQGCVSAEDLTDAVSDDPAFDSCTTVRSIDPISRAFLRGKVESGELVRYRFTTGCHYGSGQATLYGKPGDPQIQ